MSSFVRKAVFLGLSKPSRLMEGIGKAAGIGVPFVMQSKQFAVPTAPSSANVSL